MIQPVGPSLACSPLSASRTQTQRRACTPATLFRLVSSGRPSTPQPMAYTRGHMHWLGAVFSARLLEVVGLFQKHRDQLNRAAPMSLPGMRLKNAYVCCACLGEHHVCAARAAIPEQSQEEIPP